MAGRRLLAASALVLALATAARAPAPSDPGWRGLAGQFLVATEDLHDPNFVRTVVYMLNHEPGGAVGLVVNRPLGTAPLARLLEGLGLDPAGVSGEIAVHYGGPVEPGRGFVLHSSEWTGGDSLVVQPGIAVSSDPAVLDAIAHLHGPRRVLLAFGYAGWAGGQLEGEIQRGSWLVVAADEALLFDADAATKWERATARRKITL